MLPLHFPDKNLEAAIRDVLKHEPKVELTDEKLQNVYFLEATGKDIKDLTGLEKCKNLRMIKLTKNKISDFEAAQGSDESAVARPRRQRDQGHRPPGQSQGTPVYRALENQIEKLEPLSGLTSLTSLYLGGNAIKDIGPLAPLVKLWSLSLPKNQIKEHQGAGEGQQAVDHQPERQPGRGRQPADQADRAEAADDRAEPDQGLEAAGRGGQGRRGWSEAIRPYLRLTSRATRCRMQPSRPRLDALKAAGVRIEGSRSWNQAASQRRRRASFS